MTTEAFPKFNVESETNPEVINGQLALDYALQIAKDALSSMPEKGVFIDSEYLKKHAEGPGQELRCGDTIIDWPLGSIVSAEGFISWEEGRRTDNLKDGRPSIDVMRDYASRDTEIPPIDFGLEVYITPSGRIIAVSNNAHRVGAAKMREQEYIGVDTQTCGIVVKNLPDESLDVALRWARGEW